MVKKVIYELVKFLKRPDDRRIQLTLKQKIYFLLRLFVFNAVIFLAFLPLLVLVAEETESEFNRNRDYTEVIVAIGAILVMPVIEEFIFRYFLRYDRINSKLIGFKKWNVIFPWLVYFSAITFASIHLLNFSFSLNSWLLLPALVFPQFVGGLTITFIRVRLNFYYGILYHMLWNFSFFMLIPFLVDLIPE